MDARPAQHPTDQTLSAFGLGKLDAPAVASVHQHLEGCTACRQRVASLSADSFLGRVRDAQAGPGLSLLAGSHAGLAGKSAPPPRAGSVPPELAEHPDYEIKKELGRGGMGVVYLAHNRLLRRDEVLKVMGRQIMERPGVLERFRREIQTVARLNHPNIVMAYHAMRIGPSIVFAMEYVPGLDLARLVRSKGALPVAHACHFVQQAALGLQHAHEHGLVHRDIKPANLMLAKEGSRAIVKVLDFGLAKATREQPINGGLTSEGQMLGTPDCIAPEQIRNAQSADIRADIYSLGCTLYYLLTGGPPFHADNLWDLYQAHFSMDAGPLNLVRPEVPSELAALVAKMMAKEPEQRFQTPREVAQALQPFFQKANAAVASGPASVGAAPAVRLHHEPARPAAEPRWETLIEIPAEKPLAKAAPHVEPARRVPWLWAAAAAGALGLGLLIALGVTILFRTPEGTIALRDVPPDAEVLLDGENLTFRWPGAGEPIVIRAVRGQHKIEIKKGGLKAFAQSVTIAAGGAQVEVRYEPSQPPQAGVPEPTARDDRNSRATIADTPVDASQGDDESTGPVSFLADRPILSKKHPNKWFSKNGTVFGKKFSVKGKEYPRGIFLHPPDRGFSEVNYQSEPSWRRFRAGIAVPRRGDPSERAGIGSPLTFQVLGDGKLLWESAPVTEFDEPQWADVNIKLVTILTLRVKCSASAWCARAVWLDPCVIGKKDDGAAGPPKPASDNARPSGPVEGPDQAAAGGANDRERRAWKASGVQSLVNYAVGKWQERLGEGRGWNTYDEVARTADSIALVDRSTGPKPVSLLLKDDVCLTKRGESDWQNRYTGRWKRERDVPPGAKDADHGVFLADLVATELKCLGLSSKGLGGNDGTLFASDGTMFSNTFRVNGRTSPHGLFLHPPNQSFSRAVYKLGRRWSEFRSEVAIARRGTNDERRGVLSPIVFEVRDDRRTLWTSRPIQTFDQPQTVAVSVAGADVLELRVRCPGDPWCAQAVWLEPRLLRHEQENAGTDAPGAQLNGAKPIQITAEGAAAARPGNGPSVFKIELAELAK